MNHQTHTPTPWVTCPDETHEIRSQINNDIVATCFGGWAEAEASAAHIVRCVNNHDALVEALRNIAQYHSQEGYTAMRALAALEA